MSTDIVRHDDDRSLAAKVEWAKTMAVANLLPPQYQGNPGNLLYAIEYADALGIDRINAITSIHVIQGKPTASAELIASLVRRAGHKLRITGDDTHAIAQIIRADDPDFTHEATWDIKKAQAAGLWGKGNWAKYPGAMLRARAITEVARAGASDALYGVVYTADELGAKVNAEGFPVDVTVLEEAPAPRPVPRQEAVIYGNRGSAETAAAPVLSDEDFEPDPIDPKQSKHLHALATDLGLDRDAKLAGIATVLGRDVSTTKELSHDEAAKVIKALREALDNRKRSDGDSQ